MLAHRTLSRTPVYADDSWGSIYRAGDYCMPHSHLRSNASIVYMLDTGDDDPGRAAGRQALLRRSAHRRLLPGRAGPRDPAPDPDDDPGTMLIFASDYLHSVNPYHGRRPRITLSWNITLERLPGRPGEGWVK